MKNVDVYFTVEYRLDGYELMEKGIKTQINTLIKNFITFKNDNIRQLIDDKLLKTYHSFNKEFNKKLLLLTKEELDEIVASNKYIDFVSGYVIEDGKKVEIAFVEYYLPHLSEPEFDDLHEFGEEVKKLLLEINDIYKELSEKEELTPELKDLISKL